jgi:hypothetical protein
MPLGCSFKPFALHNVTQRYTKPHTQFPNQTRRSLLMLMLMFAFRTLTIKYSHSRTCPILAHFHPRPVSYFRIHAKMLLALISAIYRTLFFAALLSVSYCTLIFLGILCLLVLCILATGILRRVSLMLTRMPRTRDQVAATVVRISTGMHRILDRIRCHYVISACLVYQSIWALATPCSFHRSKLYVYFAFCLPITY